MPQGYAITIGLNSVDSSHYDGWDGKLNAAEKDATDMQTLAKSVGFTTEIIKGNNATRENVAAAIKTLPQIFLLVIYFCFIILGMGVNYLT